MERFLMRKNTDLPVLLLLLVAAVVLPFTAAAAAAGVATIDLSMAVSLHPRMSLFDFDRMGFFKVEPGLTREAFDEAVAKLKNSASATAAIEELQRLQQQLTELDRRKSMQIALFASTIPTEREAAQKELEIIAAEEERLRGLIADSELAAACPDLTDPATTRRYLAEIEAEILAAVRKAAVDGGYTLVLNATVPVPYGYPVRYQAGEMFGQGIPGINFSLFYAFLAKEHLAHPSDAAPPSRELINWLELTRFPDAVNLLPIRPYPLVLSGGECILARVMKIVYDNHKVDPEVFKVVESVIHKIDEMDRPEKKQNGQ